MIKKILKVLSFSILIFVVGVILFVFIFFNLSPQAGKAPSGEHLAEIQQSPNYQDEKFTNTVETKMEMSVSDVFETLDKSFTSKNTEPDSPLPTRFSTNPFPQPTDSQIHITWLGHSAILLQLEGKNILLDPMIGPHASPFSFYGQRFPYEQPIPVEKLPAIDAVIYSHDHYDHLDYASVLALKDRVEHFFVPLGLGSHLQSWGVEKEKITELDWWKSTEYKGMTFVATPARHFSGRGLSDDKKTLWASWVVKTNEKSIFFSGDSGYFLGFKEIGEKYGPFDFTMLECGQYNEKWANIHMMPEETVQANIDLKGKIMMPIHWGAFQLASHTWTDPVERVQAEALKLNVPIITPFIGQRFVPDSSYSQMDWWEQR